MHIYDLLPTRMTTVSRDHWFDLTGKLCPLSSQKLCDHINWMNVALKSIRRSILRPAKGRFKTWSPSPSKRQSTLNSAIDPDFVGGVWIRRSILHLPMDLEFGGRVCIRRRSSDRAIDLGFGDRPCIRRSVLDSAIDLPFGARSCIRR